MISLELGAFSYSTTGDQYSLGRRKRLDYRGGKEEPVGSYLDILETNGRSDRKERGEVGVGRRGIDVMRM